MNSESERNITKEKEYERNNKIVEKKNKDEITEK